MANAKVWVRTGKCGCLAKVGMTSLEAIRTATANPAHYLGLDKDIRLAGSRQACGPSAFLDGDMLADIRQSDQKCARVMLNGRLYDPATMNEVGQRKRERKPFFFDGAEGAHVPVYVRGHGHGDTN